MAEAAAPDASSSGPGPEFGSEVGSDAGRAAGSDAGSAIVGALRDIGERLDALEPAALADEPDAVHQLRTHVRRLRSVLGAYEPLFETSITEGIRHRYREFGRELGAVRDIEVRIQVAEAALEDPPEGSTPGGLVAVRAHLVDAEIEAHGLAHARLVERQRMPRASARRLMLADFLDAPSLTPLAAGPVDEVLGDLLEREAKRAVRRADRLTSPPTPDLLHAVRKAGRRLRYAAEAVITEPVEVFGSGAEALTEAGEDLHDVLGDHRDEVLFAEHVRRAAAHARHRGEPAELFERLAEAAERRAEAHLEQFAKARRALRKASAKWASR